MSRKQKKKDAREQSTRQLMGIDDITDYGIATRMGELVFFAIKPTNISVLPDAGVGARIYALLNVVKGTTATLPKQQKINHGEREMYYVEDSNEAIIPQELFDRAKELRQRRSVGQAVTHGRLCVRMRCSCGSRIRAKQVNGRWYWCCCRHDEKDDCVIKPVPEAQTDEAFRRLYYKLKHQSLPILEQMLETLQTIRDRRLLWSEDIVSLNKKISELSSQNQTLAFLKQNGLVDPDIFISKGNELTRQLRQAKLDKEKIMAAEGDATAQRTRELIALLEDGPDFLDRPDTELCGALVAEIIVESNDTLRFRLHNGLELRESIERTVR